jgi:rhomboid protease GluP
MKGLKKIQYNSPVILTFALISLVALGLNYLTHGATNKLLFSVYRSSPLNPLTYLRMFTHVLGHANFSHYVGNFMLILMVGPMLEEKYGSSKMIFMILFTALITGLINIAFFGNVALLGASGIAFMFILLSSFVNIEKGRIPLTFILIAILYIGNEIITGVFTSDNISQFAHIIGGVCGCIFGWGIDPERKKS